MSGQIIPYSDAGIQFVGLNNAAAMVGYLGVYTTAQVDSALAAKAMSVHTHAIADVTGLGSALSGLQNEINAAEFLIGGKADASHLHAIADVSGLQTALDAKAALEHLHAIADVTGLQTALDAKAALAHLHAIADITGLQAALNALPSTSFQTNQTYAGTITWTGTTAPSGTATLRFSWVRVGRLVFFHFRFEWTVAGAALTAAQFPFPAGMPAPEFIDGLGSTEVYVMANGIAGIINLGGVSAGNITEARLNWATGPALEGRVRFASTAVGSLQLSGCYICQS